MKPETHKPLTRQQVLAEALRLIDEEGLEACSMRKLGARLGVEAMSLYNHVENKRALLDAVVESLVLQTPLPDRAEVTPREELWVFAHSMRDGLRAHPRVLPLIAASPLRTPGALLILDRLLDTIHRAGVTGVKSIYALQVIVGYVIGHTLVQTGWRAVDLEPGPNGPSAWRQVPAEAYPRLHRLLPEVAQWNPDREFDFGLQALFQSFFGADE
ncbi:MAG: TetR/AcrR family transcriptional regulator [Nitrososphaerota archaeon]